MAEADEIDEGAHNEDSLESYYGVKPDLEFLKTFGQGYVSNVLGIC